MREKDWRKKYHWFTGAIFLGFIVSFALVLFLLPKMDHRSTVGFALLGWVVLLWLGYFIDERINKKNE